MLGCGDPIMCSTVPGRVTLGFSAAASSVSFEKLAMAAAEKPSVTLPGTVEHRHQLGELQDFPEFAAQITELKRCALGFRAHIRGDQNAQSCAVDIFDVVHIQDDFLLPFGDQTLQFKT